MVDKQSGKNLDRPGYKALKGMFGLRPGDVLYVVSLDRLSRSKADIKSELIAGKGKDGKNHLYNAGKFTGGFVYKEVPMALYPPKNASQDECNKIFMKNYCVIKTEFWKKTVKEISQLSDLVSPTGECWIYDFDTCIGRIIEF